MVPVYAFGQSHLLSVLPGSGSFLETWSRKLRVSLSLFFGDWWLPLPRAIPLLVVAGNAISCDLIENPTEAQIEEKHAEFCQALIALFEKHKVAYGWADKKLVVV